MPNKTGVQLIEWTCLRRLEVKKPCDPHPALRATLSQWERDNLPVIPSPTLGEGGPLFDGAPGEGRIHANYFGGCQLRMSVIGVVAESSIS